MPLLECEQGFLYYNVTDVTPPWIVNPPTIVFCHGVSTNSDIWSMWLPVLADQYRLIRFDTRGFGRSCVPGTGFPWSMELLVQDVLAVAHAVGVERFHMVGESLGGTVALSLAIEHRTSLQSLTVCSASHRGGSIQRAREWRTYIDEHGMESWSQMMMSLRFPEGTVPEAIYQWFHQEQAAASAASTLDLADLLIGTDLTTSLPSIGVPTLLLAPDASPFVPLEVSLEMCRQIPQCEIQVFAGARHGLVCSHGVACAQILKQFLARRRLDMSEY